MSGSWSVDAEARARCGCARCLPDGSTLVPLCIRTTVARAIVAGLEKAARVALAAGDGLTDSTPYGRGVLAGVSMAVAAIRALASPGSETGEAP